MTIMLPLLAFMVVTSVAIVGTCGPRGIMVEKLGEVYGEVSRGGGLTNGRPIALVELYVNEETGTWTLVRTYPNGIACIMVAGNNWRSNPLVTPGVDA